MHAQHESAVTELPTSSGGDDDKMFSVEESAAATSSTQLKGDRAILSSTPSTAPSFVARFPDSPVFHDTALDASALLPRRHERLPKLPEGSAVSMESKYCSLSC